MCTQVISVPNALGRSRRALEAFISMVGMVPPGTPVVLSLMEVRWICPYGAVMLLAACRHLRHQSGEPIIIRSIQPDVHAYLRRIDFFVQAGQDVDVQDSFNEQDDWSRSPDSSNVLELSAITDLCDVNAVTSRARRILEYWLDGARTPIGQIITLISEACSNIVAHSGNTGVVTIQKYSPGSVELAISDMGIGIPQSLRRVYGPLSNTSSGYIARALKGLSARGREQVGQGLGAMREIATVSGGSLYIRSEAGCVLEAPVGRTAQDDLQPFPGTHIGITFRSIP